MTTTQIEHRLLFLEQEVARLKVNGARKRQTRKHPVHVLEKIHGTFANDQAFREAMRLGRKWRDSQRPKTRGKTGTKPK